jgi:Poly (ADP-ribose) glycohydrolase (PARG), Macro domain fold
MANMPEPLDRREFVTQRLVTEHPPMWGDGNKEIVYGIACPPGSAHSGRLRYSRWPALPFPHDIDVRNSLEQVEVRPGFYDYAPDQGGPDGVEWHVNFADPHLFVAYGSGLFAQDEMQVAEHPALGSLKEALAAAGARALTVEGARPTPVLVAGVERRCRVATDANPGEGRPHGLYGNAFASASEEAVRRATTRLDPPTISNIIAIAAPMGSGRYRRDQIEYILQAAASGFGAAVIYSTHQLGRPAHVVVHSGFWGCGAFGGNRVLMLMLQIVAAGLAGLGRLVFHLGDAGLAAFDEARRTLAKIASGSCPTSDLMDRVAALGFVWGMSDGN